MSETINFINKLNESALIYDEPISDETKRFVKGIAEEDYDAGKPFSIDDFNEFKKMLKENGLSKFTDKQYSELFDYYFECYNNIDKAIKNLKESVNWDYFNRFEDIDQEYMPDIGEGETLASQTVTAVNKLIYKWYNDGDVFDNVHSNLRGWANDLSSYANWLYKYVPGKTQTILKNIYGMDETSDYEYLLKELADYCLNEDLLQSLKTDKQGSIYRCDGPFEFNEDEYKDSEYYLKESDNNHKIKIGSKVYWVGVGNEIAAEGEVIDFPVDGRMTIKWDDNEQNTYDIDHPDIILVDDYDDSVNESENKIDPNNLTTDQLSKLRKDITLNSTFTSDYENSLGIDSQLVQNFFDGYIEYLSEMIQEDIGEDKYDELDDNDWYNYINKYDTLENLEHYYNNIENPFGEGLQESIEIPGYGQEPIDETERYELYASYGLNKYGMKDYAVKDVNSGNIVREFMAKNDIAAKRKFRDE